MWKPTISGAFCLIILTACATSYDRAFSVTQTNKNSFLIESEGNQYTDRSRVQNYALLKASELCKKNGFVAFSVINDDRATDVRGSVSQSSSLGSYGGGSAFGLGSGFSSNVTTHNRMMRVNMYSASETAPNDAYDCNLVSKQLGSLKSTR